MDQFLEKFVLFSSILVSILVSSSAQSCSSYTFRRTELFRSCNDLPVLNSFLHWNYHSENHTVDIAYRHTGVTESQWVAWALNLGGSGMIGAQSLVAFKNSSGQFQAYTSPVSGYGTTLAQGDLRFEVPRLSTEFINGEMIIFATLTLPASSTTFNHVWQVGPVSGNSPGQHSLDAANKRSVGRVNFASTSDSGNDGGAPVIIPRLKRKNTHGVLNAVSWGVLMPIGAIIARYLKVFKSADPAWFYLHVACQSSAYIVGVAGWGTGLKLGSDSPGLKYNPHRNIGITMFCLGTLQVFALLLRPKKDHKYRLYWNIYHHGVGYSVIILSIINVFKGFDILEPDDKWKRAYIGIIIALGAVAASLEAFTWYIVLQRKRVGSHDNNKHPHNGNGTNGVNGYGSGSHQAA